MKKKVFSLMMTLLLAFIGVAKAEVVTIGEGTTTYYYYPVNTFFNYSLTEELYTPEEIGTAGTINAISFYYDYSSSFSMDNMTLYMKNVTRQSFASNTDMEPLALSDIVWTGTFSASAAGWVTITLDTPFAYDGTSNLLVAAFDGTSGYPGSSYKFRTTPCTGYKGIYWCSDSYTPDPYNTASGFSGSKYYTQYRANIQLDITAGGGGAGAGDQIFAVQDGDVVDTVFVGPRPNGYWMEPFTFQIRNTGANTTISRLDWTPSEYFSLVEPELPVAINNGQDIDVQLTTGTSSNTDWQMVAIYGTRRTAAIWNIHAEPYDAQTPDVWELACEEATTFPFVEVPATAHNVTLHNDYTLPFPEIPEGFDAVYKLVFTNDMILDAEVTAGADGKVALYAENFNGEGGPMATNNYTGLSSVAGGGAAGGPFEAQIGEGTSTTSYFPFYTLYNYSISENLYLASELTEAGVTTAPFTSLSWYATNAPGYAQQGISIWMANVDDEALTTSSHPVTGMTLVYTGAMTPEIGWNEFVFNQGTFSWDGSSNVLIYCQRNNGEWNSTVNWQATGSMPFTCMAYQYQDSGAYDATIANTMSTSTTRPNIIMKGGNREGGNRNIVEIGEGTSTTSRVPFNSLWGYSFVEQIYTADEIGTAGTINAISFNMSSTDTQTNTYQVFMKNVSRSTFSATSDYEAVTAADMVFSGTWTVSAGWNTLTLDTPFAYDGTSNLLIAFHEYTSGYSTRYFYYTSASDKVLSFHSDSYDPNPYDLGSYSGSSYTGSERANIQIDITPGGGGQGGGGTALNVSAGPVITDLGVRPGTYYLVASSTDPDFEVTINADPMPCPAIDAEGFAFNPTPADNADGIEPGSVNLMWNIPEYATGWRLIFGSTYYPDPNHDQTVIYPEDGSFSTNMVNHYTVRNLWNNTNYFWRVEFNNGACPDGVSSPVWGFTTHLNIPQNLNVDDETIFDDETVTLTWNPVVDRTYRNYFIYQDGVKIGETATNQIGATTYTVSGLTYNMGGYEFYVTAVYDEGESAPSNTVNVKVSGYGDVNGHVYEHDGTTGIAGATVTMVGQDEFGVGHTYNFTTDANGYYTGHIYAGSYNGSASGNGYQGIDHPIQGNPIAINYNNVTSPIDYMMDENFDPVCQVIAEYYPDSLDPSSPYVKVYWGCGLPGSDIIEDFETGDFSMFDWEVDPTYPWTITTSNPYEGTYCMKSGGAGVASVTSNMTVTVEIPNDGIMSFFGKISSENNYDYGHFYIDGAERGSWSGAGNWTERTYDITAGTHTFKWSYTKDSSVNSNDDCFYVDYINFYKQPEPALPGMTYDFDNSTMQGWTSVDADGDGYGWRVGSDVMSGVAGHNGSADFVFSQSYDNSYGVLYPDNYLVSPMVQLGGVIRFYACAQDASYAAEHFGVAVSTTNTNPSSFTTIQEWTMSAKSVNDGGKAVLNSRSGRAQGEWYEYTVDLSAYSGNGYVAIRHFNCSDMFYLDVDDITISDPGKGVVENRSLDHYRVYRTNCYNNGPYEEPTTVLLATVWVPDTVYIDVEWADLEPGVYKWGVGSVYSGNRGEETEGEIVWSEPVNVEPAMAPRQTVTIGDGTSTNYYGPFNSLWGYSFVEQVYTAAEIGTPGVINSISFNLRESDAATTNQIDVYMKNVTRTNFSDNNDWEPVTASDKVFSGTVTFNPGWTTITLDTPFQYDGNSNLMIGMHEYTSGYSSRYFYHSSVTGGLISGHSDSYNPDPTNMAAYSGTKYVQNLRSDIQIDITPGGGSGGGSGIGAGGEPIQLERESVIVWSNCLDKDMYINNVDVTVLLNSADSPEGTTVTLTNLNEAEQEMYPVAPVTLDSTGYYAWESFRRGNYSVKVEKEGYETIVEDSVSIWDETHLRYVMIEILYGVENIYVSRTGWAMWDDSHNGGSIPGGGGGQGGGTGSTFSVNFDDSQMPAGWTTIDANNDGYNWVLGSQIGGVYLVSGASLAGSGHNSSNDMICSGSYSNYTSSAITPDNYLVSPQVTLVNGSTFSFWACAQDASYAAEHYGVFVSDNGTSNWTEVQSWTMTAKNGGDVMSIGRGGETRVQGTWYQKTVDLSAYAGQKYIAIRHFACNDQFILDIDDIELSNGAKNADEMQHFEYYKVMCTSIDGVPIYNHNTVHPFCQLSTNEPYNAPLVEGEHYLCKVATVYSTGMSAWSEPVEWQYEPCDHWGPVDEVTVGTIPAGNHIEWVFDHGFNPYGGDTPGPGGNAGTFDVDFEGGMPEGWTVVDGNNDGWTWCLTSAIPTTWTYYASLTLDWYHSGSNAICSGSYINGVGALTPNEYLISPLTSLANGSTLSFWVAATDASYPADHFGVFVSDDMSNWTSVQEWTLTAKKSGLLGGAASRNGEGLRLGTWYNYSVDLSAYAGQKYIAFRHFNCNDQYIMVLDDITLTAGAKNGGNENYGGQFYTQYAEDGVMLNFLALDNVDFRVYMLYTLSNDSRFSLVAEDENGQFILTSLTNGDFMDEFETVYSNALADFDLFSKVDIANNMTNWKTGVSPTNLTSITMDVLMSNNRPDNDHCINSLPFCTSEMITFQAANTSNTANEPGMDQGCIYYSYNPSFYHMRIHTAGPFVIHMEGHDPDNGTNRDIDFCMWGPYTEQEIVSGTACQNLSTNKIMDCCYSAQYDEDCYLGYTEGQHNHHGSSTSHGTINYHMPEVGEYYILMITNYSQQPCVINFTKTEGEGETDCEIVIPTDLIGFLITEDGEYVAFAGPDDREYTVEGEYGEHEYCVRPIYPGTMVLPDQNFGWSMGCPVCAGGGDACAAGEPIHGEALTATDQVKVWWGEENPGPGPGGCEGDEFTVDFEAGLPTGWTTIDADGDGYNWNLASTTMGTGYGHNGSADMMFSQSYDNNYGALTPDNWLVSPAVTLCDNSTFSFYACAQDAAWAGEHFGVAVSEDGGNTFTMVQEWTMTAKGNRYDGPRGTRDQGNWYLYTVDLGAYAGEGRKVAIRHFNCTDYFYLDIDDLALSAGAKNMRAGIVSYNVYRSTENANYALIGNVPAVAGQTYYEYIDTPETAGSYYYQVTAVYADCESEPAMAAEGNVNYVVVGVDAVAENGGMTIYPNPTKGNVTIEANGMRHITVVSMLGQVLFDTDVDTDNYILNMSQFNAGMYTVRVVTENGVNASRITVVR